MSGSEKKSPWRVLVLLAPLLLAAVPVINLWKRNLDGVDFAGVVPSLLMAVLLATLLQGVLLLIYRNCSKAAVLTAIAVLLFSFFGYAFDVVWKGRWFEDYGQLYAVMGGGMLLYLLLFAVLIGKKKNLEPAARFFLVVSAVLVLWPCVEMVQSARSGELGAAEASGFVSQKRPKRMLDASAQRPDIYYIILDGYARQDSLVEFFGYDNSAFIQALRERGFYVADKSTSNYPMTFLSMPATLNMKYLDREIEELGVSAHTEIPFYRMIHDNEVGRFLKVQGYRYVSLNTGWGGTERSDIADVELGLPFFGLKGEFALAYVNSTAARVLLPSLSEMHHFGFASVEGVADMKEPTFTLAHMILPHEPYVFDADGNERRDVPILFEFNEANNGEAPKRMYIDQLQFANKRVLELIDHLLRESEVSPVIILQSDHGTGLVSPGPRFAGDHDPKYDPFIKERHAILNAMRVPEEVKLRLYPEISAVNTFRVLFSEMFGADYPLLPDKHYFSVYFSPFAGRDVTDLMAPRKSGEEGAAGDGPASE